MPFHEFFWTATAIRKIEDNGLTVRDVEYAVLRAKGLVASRSSGRPACKGRTPDGALIFVTFEIIDSVLISVVTAYRIDRKDEV
jgi:uncharacterized DUF497 family protein